MGKPLTIDRSRAKKMHQHYHQMKTVKAILDHERESQHVNSVVTIVNYRTEELKCRRERAPSLAASPQLQGRHWALTLN